MDVDKNLRRGAGPSPRKLHEVTLNNKQDFSEEKELELKRSIAELTEADGQPEVPAYVHDLSQLGIEHRRLMTRRLSHSPSQERVSQQGQMVSEQKFAPVCEQSGSASTGTSSTRTSGSRSRRPLVRHWTAKLDKFERINSRRLVSAYSINETQRRNMPKFELTKSLLNLMTAPVELTKGQRCATETTTVSSIDEDSLADITSEGEHAVNPKTPATESAACSDTGEPVEPFSMIESSGEEVGSDAAAV